MSYLIPKRFTGKERSQIQRIISKGIENNTPARQIKAKLREKGLGYRDTNLFSDIARKKATYHPIVHDKKFIRWERKTPEGQKASLKWYDSTIQKYRDNYKQKTGKSLSPKKAVALWDKAKKSSKANLSQAELDDIEEIWEYYEAM